MHGPRNDTLGAIVKDVIYLNDCSTNLCYDWQYHEVIVSSIMLIFIALIAIFSTYQMCFVASKKEITIKKDIQCLSLSYFYCLFIVYICLLLIPIIMYKPMVVSGGWEYNESGGWFYDSNTSGWYWNNDWEWNTEGSWQWTSNGGWYYTGENELHPIWMWIMLSLFIINFIIGSLSTCFSYLYPFKRLYHSFTNSELALKDNSKNMHYINAILIFILAAISSFSTFSKNHKLTIRMGIAGMFFYSFGLGIMMYQFNKRLLHVVVQSHQFDELSSRSPNGHSQATSATFQITEMTADADNANTNVHKSQIQLKLIHVVVKYTVLTAAQYIIYTLCSIILIVLNIASDEEEQTDVIGKSHISGLWIAAIVHGTVSMCMFLGFGTNSAYYDKLCILCHAQVAKTCNKYSSQQILQKQLELSAKNVVTKSAELSDNASI
eukprot:68059_1